MKNSDLEKLLKSVPVPQRTEEYWEDFPGQVVRGLRAADRAERREKTWSPKLAWSLGALCVCVMIGWAVIHRQRAQEMGKSFASLQDEKTLREVFTLFPQQVRAIVRDEQGTRLVISEKADVPESRPLWIEICDGKRCQAIVTFSGQNLQIAGEKVEVLADAQGRVMLVGDRLFWSDRDKSPESAHLRIRARPLAYAL